MAVLELEHNELLETIGDNYAVKIPIYIWGKTGIGKSEVVRQKAIELAKIKGREYVEWNKTSLEEKKELLEHPEKYFVLFDIRLSQMDPSDLRGIPSMNSDIDYSRWKIPMWEYLISKKDADGIVFFDEVNLAPPSIQSASYQIILDRAIGEISLSNNILCIAAGNRTEDRANVFDLPDPLQNRFTHVTLKPPKIIAGEPDYGWLKWAINNKIDSRIIAFLQMRPNLLNPERETKSDDRAFPTPRSWGKYCNALINKIDSKDLNKISRYASISIGSAVASEFVSFIKMQQTIPIKEILKNPEKASEITQLDMLYALQSLMVEWYDKNQKREHLSTVFKVALNIKDEFGILLLRQARERHPSSFTNIAMRVPEWKDISNRYGKFLVS